MVAKDTLVMRGLPSRILGLAALLAGVLVPVSAGWAQGFDPPRGPATDGRLGRGLLSGQSRTASTVGPGGGETGVTVEARFTAPAGDQPARLFIIATMAPTWNIYSTEQQKPLIAAEIRLDPSEAYRTIGEFRPSPPPKRERDPNMDNLVIESHSGKVIWHAPIELRPGTDLKKLRITGSLYAQACKGGRCFRPRDYPFAATLAEASEVAELERAAAQTGPELDYGALPLTLALAFLGGLILNLMPCVLPVVSLKLLAFMEQAGESRGRVLALNLWYTLGLLSVFMVLAALAAGAGLAWGEQFTLPWFKVALIGLVFVMALSFLGVWEMPIPGFVGAGGAGRLEAREGASGAFFKGVFATILATPCSAPLLGPIFGSLLNQPPVMAYWVFGAIGLGMASPYLVIGAFPTLIRFLPKPGAWMETLRQVMGFLLLGTVVYLFSAMTEEYFIPTLTLLVGLWFACWLVGRTPLTVGPQKRLAAWAGGILTAALVGLLAFTVLFWEPIIPWRPFSPEALAKARAEGKTVMVDFTADWCPNCKWNSRWAIERREVLEVIQQNRVVPLLADWTDRSLEIKKALNELGANSIPVLAIWPPEGEAVVLKDVVTKRQVLDALAKAGPSKPQTSKDEGAVAMHPR